MMIHRVFQVVTSAFLAAAICAPLVEAQTTAPQQAPSVADAARKAREESRSRPQAAKVFTNEDVPNLKGIVSVVGIPPAEPAAAPAGQPPTTPPADTTAPAPSAPGAATPAPAAPAPQVRDEAYWRKAFADARKKLADDTRELDILQREYNLKQQQFYMDPNVALREQNNRADLNRTLEQINTKKLDVERDQQAIATLEDELRQSGGQPAWSREPTP
jgi:hypothetical protein